MCCRRFPASFNHPWAKLLKPWYQEPLDLYVGVYCSTQTCARIQRPSSPKLKVRNASNFSVFNQLISFKILNQRMGFSLSDTNMLWILFLLPAVTWAGQPAILGLPPPQLLAPVNSLGPIDGVCPYKCKPLSQCSVWYRDFSFIPQKPCSSPEGFVGVCCPDVLNVKREFLL